MDGRFFYSRPVDLRFRWQTASLKGIHEANTVILNNQFKKCIQIGAIRIFLLVQIDFISMHE